MDCELCGKPGARYLVEIDGLSMTVCETCGRPYEKKPLSKPAAQPRSPSSGFSQPVKPFLVPKNPVGPTAPFELVANWNILLRRARESRGWKIDEAALQLKEHASVLKRLEHGELLPSDAQIPRLEKVFGLKLRAPAREDD